MQENLLSLIIIFLVIFVLCSRIMYFLQRFKEARDAWQDNPNSSGTKLRHLIIGFVGIFVAISLLYEFDLHCWLSQRSVCDPEALGPAQQLFTWVFP